jgi:hypothetical protein
MTNRTASEFLCDEIIAAFGGSHAMIKEIKAFNLFAAIEGQVGFQFGVEGVAHNWVQVAREEGVLMMNVYAHNFRTGYGARAAVWKCTDAADVAACLRALIAQSKPPAKKPVRRRKAA